MADSQLDTELCKMLSEIKIGGSSLTKRAKKLTDEVKKKEKLSSESIKAEISEAIKKKEEVQKNMNDLRKTIKEKEEELKQMNKVLAGEEENDLYKNEAKLYRMITKITWDLDCPEGFIAGYTTRNGLKSFKIDTTKHSPFFIANHLWDLCSADDDGKTSAASNE